MTCINELGPTRNMFVVGLGFVFFLSGWNWDGILARAAGNKEST